MSSHIHTHTAIAASPTQPLDDPFYPGRDPFITDEREHIINEVMAGRAILVTYMMVCAVFLALVVTIHWSKKAAIYLQSGLPQKSDNVEPDLESTPLLSKTACPHGPLRRIWLWIGGALMKQPQGDGCEWLEDYGTMLALSFYYLAGFTFLFYRYSFMIVLAFRLGLLCVANVPLMYILGAKHTPFSWLTGWSYEQLNVFHRHVGRVCVCTLVAHTTIFLYFFRLQYLFTHQWSVMGITAAICFVVIGVSSLRNLRQRFYELFYILHFAGMLLALPAIFFHYPTARPFVIVAAFSVLYDRVVRIVYDYRLVYSHVEVQSGETVIIRIPKGGTNTGNHRQESFKCFPNPIAFLTNWFLRPLTWNTGQHVFITIVGCGLFESHPFTIASSSETSETMDIIIRARDGLTKRLLDQQRTKGSHNRWIIVHGPYGVHPAGIPSFNNDAPRQKIVLVAGGAGIAFTYPLYEEYRLALDRMTGRNTAGTMLKRKLLELQKQEPVSEYDCSDRSTHHTRSSSSSSSTPVETASLTQEIVIEFLWVIPHRDYIDWLPGLKTQLTAGSLTKDPRLHTRVWVTREAGRPDIDHEVKAMIGSADNRDCWVATCGPDYLVRQVRNTVAELRMRGLDNVNFYAEKFGW